MGRSKRRFLDTGELEWPCLDPRRDSDVLSSSDHFAWLCATLALLQHFRNFLKSDCAEMRDPYDSWQERMLNKEQARRKLHWLIDVAINRKAGIPDHETNWPLVRLANRVNTPRLLVREKECPLRYRKRLSHRFWREDDF